MPERTYVTQERSGQVRAEVTSGSPQAQSQGGLAPRGDISVFCPSSFLRYLCSDVILATLSGEVVVRAQVSGSEAQDQPLGNLPAWLASSRAICRVNLT